MSTLIVDFSAVFWRQWHASGNEAVNFAKDRAVGQIRAHAVEARGFPLAPRAGAVIALDAGNNWRRKLWPEYKANRPDKDALALEQLRLCEQELRDEGYPMVRLDGFEADDVIASLVASIEGHKTILTADKDLLQLLGSECDLYHLARDKYVFDLDVKSELGIAPSQVAEWLALTGDASDNVPGVTGIGPKSASKLLAKHGTLAGIFDALGTEGTFTPALEKNLREAASRDACPILMSLQLVRLTPQRAMACITPELLAAIKAPRKPQPNTATEENMTIQEFEPEIEAPRASEPAPTRPHQPEAPSLDRAPEAPATAALATLPRDWTRQLEPADSRSAYGLAKVVVASRMFPAYGAPEAALLVLMAGREFGLGAMASLRSFHIIEGKPTMSAQAMMARCLEHASCEHFRVVRSECTNELATVSVRRVGWQTPEIYTWSLDDAKRAGLAGRGNWSKYPREMLINRCIAEAARFTWPEVMAGVYAPEEFGGAS